MLGKRTYPHSEKLEDLTQLNRYSHVRDYTYALFNELDQQSNATRLNLFIDHFVLHKQGAKMKYLPIAQKIHLQKKKRTLGRTIIN